MGPELLAAIAGPIAGAVIGTGAFLSRRNIAATDAQLRAISENIEVISHQVTSIQVSLPTNYATKQELAAHIQSEERWHRDLSDQMRDLRDEVVALRSASSYNRGSF